MGPPSGRDRRKLRRYAKRIPAMFVSGSLCGQGHVKNLSKGGVFMRTERLPDPGAEVSILIQSPDGRKVEVTGTVCWTTDQIPAEDAQPGFGMQISTRNEAYLEFFGDLLLN